MGRFALPRGVWDRTGRAPEGRRSARDGRRGGAPLAALPVLGAPHTSPGPAHVSRQKRLHTRRRDVVLTAFIHISKV
jgi:hypothetical protein